MKINKTKAFFAGLGAIMIIYFIISLAIFFFSIFIVTFSGVSPAGGFDMFLMIFKMPLWISIPCVLISLYSIGYFYLLSKSKKRVERLEDFVDRIFR